MTRRYLEMVRTILFVLVVLRSPAIQAGQKLTIVVGDQSTPVEKYAAQELAKYVRALSTFTPAIASDRVATLACPTILVGSPSTNRHIAKLAGNLEWDSLVADGFYLKTVGTGPEVLVVGGRSPRATLFGVYELLEHWGMRFSLTEDVFPDRP